MYFHTNRCRRGRASLDDFGPDTVMKCFGEPTDFVTDTVATGSLLPNLGLFILNSGTVPDFWKYPCSGKWDKAGSWV
jgi:hypothetical protein